MAFVQENGHDMKVSSVTPEMVADAKREADAGRAMTVREMAGKWGVSYQCAYIATREHGIPHVRGYHQGAGGRKRAVRVVRAPVPPKPENLVSADEYANAFIDLQAVCRGIGYPFCRAVVDAVRAKTQEIGQMRRMDSHA